MRYSRRISNYQEIITLYDSTHMMNMIDPLAIDVETSKIKTMNSFEKEFIELIRMKP